MTDMTAIGSALLKVNLKSLNLLVTAFDSHPQELKAFITWCARYTA